MRSADISFCSWVHESVNWFIIQVKVGLHTCWYPSVVLKPSLWTNTSLVSLVPSPGALLCSNILHSALLAKSPLPFWKHFQLYPSRLWSVLRRVLIILIALLTACDGALPFGRTKKKKKSACHLKTLQLVSLARLLQNKGPPRSCYFIQCFWEDLMRDFTSESSHCWEIPNSLGALDSPRPLVLDSPKTFHEHKAPLFFFFPETSLQPSPV